jgi:hypothetical protein
MWDVISWKTLIQCVVAWTLEWILLIVLSVGLGCGLYYVVRLAGTMIAR